MNGAREPGLFTYEAALRRTSRYTPRERVLILMNFDNLWQRWFGITPDDEQRELFQRALRTRLAEED